MKQLGIKYTLQRIDYDYYDLALPSIDDLHNFEYFLFTIKSIREHHLIQEPEMENKDKMRVYLRQIEEFFSPNSTYKITIPVGVLDIPDYEKNTYFYMICDLQNQTALLSNIND